MKELHNVKISGLTHLEAGQLVKRNIDDPITANILLTTDPIIAMYHNRMIADSTLMDLALIQIRKQQETDNLELLDMERDTSVRVLNLQLKVYKSSKDAAEKNAYRTLKIPFDAYKGIEKLNYEAENNAIDNFVNELAKPVYANSIALLNLSGLITRMDNDNQAFKDLFSTRSTTVASTVSYDAKAIRKTMIANYNAYATYVLSLTNATKDQPINAYYSSIFNIVDNIRKYYSDLLARREGGGGAAPTA